MIKVRWTVPVTFESTVYANIDDDSDVIYDACSEMVEEADIKDFDESSIEVDWNSIEKIEDWEMS